jgi:antitoxin component YwqK of YwqJK toxin-antitoxin module
MSKQTLSLMILFLIICKYSQAQTCFYQMLDKKTIKVFYNASADLTIEKYADYYRIASIDTLSLSFHGEFSDFDIKGNKVLSGSFMNDNLEGPCKYFYDNNRIKEAGNYKSGVRDSIWTFYYPNGQLEKIINFINGQPYIASRYSRNGKQLIINGNGKYSGGFYKNNGKTQKYFINGELVNGKLNGQWIINGITQELFDNGKFIKGYDVLPYTYPQQISLDNILGFYCQENLNLFQNKYFCNSCIENVSWALYNVTANVNNYPYDTFLSGYAKILDSLNISNLTQIIEFHVNKNGTINNINTISTFSAFNEHILTDLLTSIPWIPLQCDNNSDGFVFMKVIKHDDQLFLPKPIVLTNNLEANFMIKSLSENDLMICH